ncbi:MAG: hypothetical protein DCO99_03585 [Synechococcus sp. XM-24]|nr:MAG: hypothetical protein DCO99_03585 [Synechococcus sp. XM-24]
MAKRRKHQPEPEPRDFNGRQMGRFPEQWSEIDPVELQRRHDQAALLIARGYGSLQWDRTHGEG